MIKVGDFFFTTHEWRKKSRERKGGDKAVSVGPVAQLRRGGDGNICGGACSGRRACVGRSLCHRQVDPRGTRPPDWPGRGGAGTRGGSPLGLPEVGPTAERGGAHQQKQHCRSGWQQCGRVRWSTTVCRTGANLHAKQSLCLGPLLTCPNSFLAHHYILSLWSKIQYLKPGLRMVYGV